MLENPETTWAHLKKKNGTGMALLTYDCFKLVIFLVCYYLFANKQKTLNTKIP